MASGLSILVHQLQAGDVVLAVALLLLGSCTVYCLLRLCRLAPGGQLAQRYVRFAWQIGIMLGLEQMYEFMRGRIIHPGQSALAFLNAYRLLDLEWRHGLFVEFRVERFFLQSHAVMSAVDLFYVLAHLLVTIGVVVWVYARRHPTYPFMRNMLVVTTGLALIAFYVYPTAPPRLLYNYGFVDTLQFHHLVPAGGEQPYSYTYDPYAAMPSLHVAYALVVSWTLLLACRSWSVRALALFYPLAMAAAVVISGNHWVLDVAGAVMTVALARALLLMLSTVQAMVRNRAVIESVIMKSVLMRRRRVYTLE